MKKISTVAVQQSRNVSQPQLTIGLDLGDRTSWYCVLDEAGTIVLEQKLGTTPKAMKEVFGGMPGCRIALETGMHSPWVSRALSEWGHEVIVAHARRVRLIGESRKKDDRLDAQTLARLARIDPQLLCPVKHRSAKAQADLTVIRARAGCPTHRVLCDVWVWSPPEYVEFTITLRRPIHLALVMKILLQARSELGVCTHTFAKCANVWGTRLIFGALIMGGLVVIIPIGIL